MSQQPPGNSRGTRPGQQPGGDSSYRPAAPPPRQQPPSFGQFGQARPANPYSTGASRGGFDSTQPLPPRPDLAGPPGTGYEPDRSVRRSVETQPQSRQAAPSRPRGSSTSAAEPWDERGYDDEWVDEPPRPSGRSSRRAAAPAPEPAYDPGDPDAWDLEFAESGSLDAEFETEEAWDEDRGSPTRPTRRSSRSRAQRPATAPGRPRAGVSIPSVRVPRGVSRNALTADSLSLGLIGAGLLSVLLMALVLATQAGKLPPSFVQHLDAAGTPDRWGSARVLWRIPLIALGVTAMNGVLAWFLAPRDRFASRFVLAAALLVQFIAWIALFDFI